MLCGRRTMMLNASRRWCVCVCDSPHQHIHAERQTDRQTQRERERERDFRTCLLNSSVQGTHARTRARARAHTHTHTQDERFQEMLQGAQLDMSQAARDAAFRQTSDIPHCLQDVYFDPRVAGLSQIFLTDSPCACARHRYAHAVYVCACYRMYTYVLLIRMRLL